MSFTIPMSPVPKGRPRTCTKNGRTWTYTDKKTVEAEALMRSFAKGLSQFPEGVPLSVEIWFYLAKPKSVKREYPTVKPDLDNFTKTLDAFNNILFKDEQIVDCNSHKRYGDPRIEVKIETLLEDK